MIRALCKDDIDIICALYSTDFLDGWSKGQLLSAFDTNRFLAVGKFKDGKLVGVITVSLAVDDADLEGIVVAKDFRQQGFATELFAFMEKNVKEQKKEKIFLEVRENNLPAINFYIKNGFKKISVRKNYYRDGENATVMVKEI